MDLDEKGKRRGVLPDCVGGGDLIIVGVNSYLTLPIPIRLDSRLLASSACIFGTVTD